MAYDDYTRGKRGYDDLGLDIRNALASQVPGAREKAIASSSQQTRISHFPLNHFVPAGSEVIEIRRVREIDPGQTFDLLTFNPVALGITGGVVRFIRYGIFNDGLLEDDYSFLPLVNGMRALRFHGNPAKNFLLSLGLAPDLSDNSMVSCQLVLQPNQTLVWRLTNKSLVSTVMGVRMSGYVDMSEIRETTRFGGG